MIFVAAVSGRFLGVPMPVFSNILNSFGSGDLDWLGRRVLKILASRRVYRFVPKTRTPQA
jgi:hypothetical protein